MGQPNIQPCGNCPYPICDPGLIVCDSISASKSKCGATDPSFSTNHKYWLKKSYCFYDSLFAVDTYDPDSPGCPLTRITSCDFRCGTLPDYRVPPAGFKNPTDGLYYKKRTATWHQAYDYDVTTTDTSADGTVVTSRSIHQTLDTVDTDTYECVGGIVTLVHGYVSGTYILSTNSRNLDQTGNPPRSYDAYDHASSSGSCSRDSSGVWTGSETGTENWGTSDPSVSPSSGSFSLSADLAPGGSHDWGNVGDNVTSGSLTPTITDDTTYTYSDPIDSAPSDLYENEYTTDSLKSKTVSSLPSYPGTYSGSCSAILNLSADEYSYTIRRTKPQLKHYPTSTCYLKVWIRARFRPSGGTGSTDVLTDIDPYEWVGTGNPCLTDATKLYNDDANKITFDLPELTEADCPSNGSIFYEIKKWSCQAGYEPDDPNDDGSRPSPDTHPNGYAGANG